MPASHFQVKKEGKNNGRWFYTCQHSKDEGCGFFLWGEEAEGREMKAVVGNSRSEPSEGRQGETEVTPERKKPGEDEFGDWPLSPGEKIKAEQSPSGAYPETPSKAARTAIPITPGSKRKRDEDNGLLPTPVTGGNRFADLGAGNFNNDEDVFSTQSTNATYGIRSPSNTPTPNRFLFGTSEPPKVPHSPSKKSYDISEEVMSLLKDQHLDETVALGVKELLNRYEMRVSGIAKGRDITRVALKAKEEKITELEMKISGLQRERELDRAVIRQLKGDMANSIAERGRGRGKS